MLLTVVTIAQPVLWSGDLAVKWQGVAALAGRQTRQHRDLDLNIDAADLSCCLAVLGGLGYAAETDWLPSRIELRAPGDRWVDVHPVTFDEDGSGRQADLDGGFFEYPPDAFGLAGRNLEGCSWV